MNWRQIYRPLMHACKRIFICTWVCVKVLILIVLRKLLTVLVLSKMAHILWQILLCGKKVKMHIAMWKLVRQNLVIKEATATSPTQ